MAAQKKIRDTHRYSASLFVFLTILTFATSTSASAGVFASPDGRTDPYLLLHEAGFKYEVPDCAHSKFGPHITQRYDSTLDEPVFAFHLHAEFDNDRCIVFDRQRTEITTFRSKGRKGDIRTFQWRFKLNEYFVPSTYFNHIFQIRPIDPVPGGNPVFTISTRSGETEELLFYHDTGSGMRVLHRMPLAEFKGRWVNARVRAKFSPSGFIEVQLTSTLGEAVLLEWRQDPINLWPWNEIQFTLPKWGNYRSLESTVPLRDEVVLYNDFCVVEENESCEKLEMINQFNFDIRPVALGLPDEISIDPFPTDQAVPRNSMLRLLRQMLLTASNLESRVQPERLTVESGADERSDVKDVLAIECKTIDKLTASKQARSVNPFSESPACRRSRPRLLLD